MPTVTRLTRVANFLTTKRGTKGDTSTPPSFRQCGGVTCAFVYSYLIGNTESICFTFTDQTKENISTAEGGHESPSRLLPSIFLFLLFTYSSCLLSFCTAGVKVLTWRVTVHRCLKFIWVNLRLRSAFLQFWSFRVSPARWGQMRHVETSWLLPYVLGKCLPSLTGGSQLSFQNSHFEGSLHLLHARLLPHPDPSDSRRHFLPSEQTTSRTEAITSVLLLPWHLCWNSFFH